MYRIDSEKAKKLLEEGNKVDKISEDHFLLGRRGIFSFDECGSYYALIKRSEECYLKHVYEADWEFEEKISKVQRERAVEFLTKMGYEPFMSFEITKHFIEYSGRELRIEEIGQLGFFVNKEDLGTQGIFYGDLLKKEMIEDSDRQEEVLDRARKIL